MDDLANYATIIMALAMVNVVWQLEKASKLLGLINRFLIEGAEEDE
jgi:hypothetical protein|tara:strand:+ start:483 stop:620 length:138 start_codon:yes stop_codon:yes gene_type:complete